MADFDFTITKRGQPQIRKALAFKGSIKSARFDFAPWAEDEGTITGVTWQVVSGKAAIASKALASNIATSVITTSGEGWSLIKISATTSVNTNVVFLAIFAKNPELPTFDFGRWV